MLKAFGASDTSLQLQSALLSAVQAQVNKQKLKEVLGTIAGKVDEPKLVGGGLRWWVACSRRSDSH